MVIRHSTAFGVCVSVLLLLSAGLSVHGLFSALSAGPSLARKAALVRNLQLTDLCLFTEASYTRHLSLADLNTPFQDSPLSFEHFPSGALSAVPQHLSGIGTSRMIVRKNGR